MVTSQKVGEYGVFFAGFAGKKHPNPHFIEMILSMYDKILSLT